MLCLSRCAFHSSFRTYAPAIALFFATLACFACGAAVDAEQDDASQNTAEQDDASRETSQSSRQESAPSAAQSSVNPGINRRYLSEDLDVATWQARFETESREVFEARQRIVKRLEIAKDAIVADLGAGTGAFLEPLRNAVGPQGTVYAVDISPRFIEHLRGRVRTNDWNNVEVIRNTATETGLPQRSVDLILTVDAYHHFTEYEQLLASIRGSLKPGGRFVVVDFERIPGQSSQWVLDHVRAGKPVVVQEVQAAGFVLVNEIDIAALQENYMLVFRRPL